RSSRKTSRSSRTAPATATISVARRTSVSVWRRTSVSNRVFVSSRSAPTRSFVLRISSRMSRRISIVMSVGSRSEEHTSELQSLPTRRSSDLEILAQDVAQLTHRARDRDDLGGEADLGLRLAAHERVEPRVRVVAKRSDPLVRLADLVADVAEDLDRHVRRL